MKINKFGAACCIAAMLAAGGNDAAALRFQRAADCFAATGPTQSISLRSGTLVEASLEAIESGAEQLQDLATRHQHRGDSELRLALYDAESVGYTLEQIMGAVAKAWGPRKIGWLWSTWRGLRHMKRAVLPENTWDSSRTELVFGARCKTNIDSEQGREEFVQTVAEYLGTVREVALSLQQECRRLNAKLGPRWSRAASDVQTIPDIAEGIVLSANRRGATSEALTVQAAPAVAVPWYRRLLNCL
jgi:hypothetical protein